MYKLLEFIRSIYVVLLFVVLEGLAIHYYANSTYRTQARLLSRSNQLVGGVYGTISGIKHYFLLGGENEVLLERVIALETQLAGYRTAAVAERLDSAVFGSNESPYRLMMARVIANSVNQSQNLITLNKGRRDGVTEQMAVLSPDGAMVGYVVDCSEGYAVALSILNTSFRASGKLAGGDYSGSIYWDRLDMQHVMMTDVSKYADPQPGTEVVSTGFSLYFPADILIGEVESAEVNENKTFYTIRIRLAVDMSRLGDVILVENVDLAEVQALHSSDKVKQHTQHPQ